MEPSKTALQAKYQHNVPIGFNEFKESRSIINSISSYKFIVSSAVPQGSRHLGRLLFLLLFINDLPKVVKYSKCLLFADDLKIYRSISNLNECCLLQLAINAVVNCCELNNFS